jgi:hypothetical protein
MPAQTKAVGFQKSVEESRDDATCCVIYLDVEQMAEICYAPDASHNFEAMETVVTIRCFASIVAPCHYHVLESESESDTSPIEHPYNSLLSKSNSLPLTYTSSIPHGVLATKISPHACEVPGDGTIYHIDEALENEIPHLDADSSPENSAALLNLLDDKGHVPVHKLRGSGELHASFGEADSAWSRRTVSCASDEAI